MSKPVKPTLESENEVANEERLQISSVKLGARDLSSKQKAFFIENQT